MVTKIDPNKAKIAVAFSGRHYGFKALVGFEATRIIPFLFSSHVSTAKAALSAPA